MTSFQSDRAETQYVDGVSARFAYRRIGPRSGAPLVMAMRFRGTIDHWDPELLDVLGSERDVIVFDNVGTGYSSGTAPTSIEGLAQGLLDFVDALDLSQVDLLGWSMGGYVVQGASLLRPTLVRRLIVAGSGPGRVPGMPATPAKVWPVAAKPENSAETFSTSSSQKPTKGDRPG